MTNSGTFTKQLFSLVLLAALIILTACEQSAEKKEADAYRLKLNEERRLKDIQIIDSTQSRFNDEERAHFAQKGLQYFEPDIEYRLRALLEVDTSSAVFQMPTTTDRKPNYRIYGYLRFTLKDTGCILTAYQNMDYIDDPEYGKMLFVPFKDHTNDYTTYGGGRYIDVPIPEKKNLLLDFNEAYNPYCAYSDRWSCPLVPANNTLEVSVFAGEKAYK